MTIQFENVQLDVRADSTHEWLLETSLVARGYGVQDDAIRYHKSKNADEFVEGKHFIGVRNTHTVGNGGSEKTFWTKKGVIRLGFLIKSERAKLFRDWAEDLVIQAVTPQKPLTTPNDDFTLMIQGVQAMNRIIEKQNETIGALLPKAAYTDEVLLSTSEWTITVIAKELGMTANKLNAALFANDVQYRTKDGVWVLYAKHDGKGYTKTRTTTYTDTKTLETKTAIMTVWTEKGREFIHSLFKK